ncbi:MAG: hypothetical protein AAF800_00985 [Planctomycetota bacterium]
MDATEFNETFRLLPTAAVVRDERFCVGCGYNLLGQPVKLEPNTGLPVVMCPECGRFTSVADGTRRGSRWGHQATSLLLIAWMFGLLGFQAVLGFMLFITLWVYYGVRESYAYRASGVFDDAAGYLTFGVAAGVVAVFGLIAGTARGLALPHWNRVGQLVWPLLWAVAGFLPAFSMLWANHRGWRQEVALAVGLEWFALTAIGVAVGVATSLAGGVVARWCARRLLPRAVRSPMVYLWAEAGLEPPDEIAQPHARQRV